MHAVVDEYNAFKLNEYRGTYEIVGGNDSNGTFYPAWTIASIYDANINSSVPVKKDDGKYRNVPVKIILGTKEQAIQNLKWLLKQLTGTDSSDESSESLPDESSESLPEDDVPF